MVCRIKMVSSFPEMRNVSSVAAHPTVSSGSNIMLLLGTLNDGRYAPASPPDRCCPCLQAIHLVQMQMPIANVRFMAVSATIPNVQDIAEWLHVPPEGLKVGRSCSSRMHVTWLCTPLHKETCLAYRLMEKKCGLYSCERS